MRFWCNQNELSINPNKAEAILFTRKYSTVHLKVLFFNESQIEMLSEVKYLSVILDSKLNWNSLLKERLNKSFGNADELAAPDGV